MRLLLLLSLLILQENGQKVCSWEKYVQMQFSQICMGKKQKPENESHLPIPLNQHPKLKHIPTRRLKVFMKITIERGVNIFFKNLIFTINQKFFQGILKFLLDILFKAFVDLFSRVFTFFFYQAFINLLFMGISKKLNLLLVDAILDNFIKAAIEVTLTKYVQPLAVSVGKKISKFWKSLQLGQRLSHFSSDLRAVRAKFFPLIRLRRSIRQFFVPFSSKNTKAFNKSRPIPISFYTKKSLHF